MRTDTATIDVQATPQALWAALTSPEHTPSIMAGLRVVSAWRPDVVVTAYHGAARIAAGSVVVADPPRLLVYRLDDPATGEVDCWISWQLCAHEAGITRVVLSVDSDPIDPPVDSIRLLSNLKTYAETAVPLTPVPPAGFRGGPAAGAVT